MQRASHYCGDGSDHPYQGCCPWAGQPSVPENEENPFSRGTQRSCSRRRWWGRGKEASIFSKLCPTDSFCSFLSGSLMWLQRFHTVNYRSFAPTPSIRELRLGGGITPQFEVPWCTVITFPPSPPTRNMKDLWKHVQTVKSCLTSILGFCNVADWTCVVN